jgi:leader peptidase (prepilin peptidase) / N-methyltransferase
VTSEEPRRRGGPALRWNVVETSLVGAVGLCAIWASLAAAPGWSGAAGAALAALMLAIAVVDRRQMIIPDELNALAFVAGLAEAGLRSPQGPMIAVLYAVLRAAMMFAAFFAFRAAYRRLRGIEGMGMGDVKLAAVAGAWLDWLDLPIAVDVAAFSALAVVLIARIRGGSLDLRAKLPLGAFFAPTIWLCWLFATWRDGPTLGSGLAALAAAR